MEPRDVALVLGAAVAMLGWLVSKYHALQLARRKDQLDLINKRLDDFYGPVYVATRAGRAAYEGLLRHLGVSEGIFVGSREPAIEELKEWHHWMQHVLLPLNNVIEKAILENAYLIVEKEMPQHIIDYMNHVAATRATVAHWEAGDYSRRVLPVRYPLGLDEYIANSYRMLKTEQLRLIGVTFVQQPQASEAFTPASDTTGRRPGI